MVLAGCFLANTILSCFAIETEVLSYTAGIGILPLLFIYLSSSVFKFCVYHRMFIYYIYWKVIVYYNIDYDFWHIIQRDIDNYTARRKECC